MKLLEIKTDALALFKVRINKYLAIVDIISPLSQKNVEVHIHDPGRLGEILFPDNKLLLKYIDKQGRKTKWDVIAGLVENNFILIHSNYHRKIAEAIFENNIIFQKQHITSIKPEAKYGNSRIDFFIVLEHRKNIWLEVKGCTLVKNNIALFPDAPTKRGLKHLKSLMEIRQKGDYAKLLILIFNPSAEVFSPNGETDPEFYKLFYECNKIIDVYPITLEYKSNFIHFVKHIPVIKNKHLN